MDSRLRRSPRHPRKALPRHSRTDLPIIPTKLSPAIPALPPVIPAKLSPVIPAKAGIHNSAPIIKQLAVYIMASQAKETLYTNVTSNLKNWMWGLGVGSLAIRTSSLTNLGNGSLQGVGYAPLCPTYIGAAVVFDGFLPAQASPVIPAQISPSFPQNSLPSSPQSSPPSFPRRRESITVHLS